uniref:Co-chaperonin GroES n=1 Tax=uncultured virus TaxID=340016 RepID=A0A221S3A8_9VIRU|nr:co-chaperonin GroES [uncultured virus]
MIVVTGCRILIKPFKLQEHDKVYDSAKKAGIILTELSERKEQVNVDKGTVLQIGAKCHEDYVGDLAVGDIIAYAKFGGKFISEPNSDEIFLVISDEDVVCIFKENK